MDSIVKKLTEIEHAAAAIVKYAENQKKELEKEMRQKQQQFDEGLKAETEQRLSDTAKESEQQMSDEKARIQREQDTKIHSLLDEYEQRRVQYAEEIVKRIREV